MFLQGMKGNCLEMACIPEFDTCPNLECQSSKEWEEIELQERIISAVSITYNPLWSLAVPIVSREWFCKILHKSVVKLKWQLFVLANFVTDIKLTWKQGM